MKGCLEKFINSNRAAFDDTSPSSQIWESISHNLTTEKRTAKEIPMRRFLVWAAAITVTVSSIIVFLLTENAKLKNDLISSEQRLEQQELKYQDHIAVKYKNEINQFFQIVSIKQKQLSLIQAEYPSLYQSFTSDIKDLNIEYENLRQELKIVPKQDEVLDAMIQNLKLQAELLNEQLFIIQQLKSSKKNRNETSTSVI